MKSLSGSYMRVEATLRYLRKNALPLKQYKLGDNEGHFFDCKDIAQKIGKREFNIMECEVTQYLIFNDENQIEKVKEKTKK